VKFDRRPQLDALIRELTEAFSIRYEEPPSSDHVQGLKRARANNVDPSIMRLLPAFDYQKRLNGLSAPNWLVDTFKRNLNADFWPPPQTKLEGSQLVQDLVRSGRGSRASWRWGFWA
jgi:hypothetical protein